MMSSPKDNLASTVFVERHHGLPGQSPAMTRGECVDPNGMYSSHRALTKMPRFGGAFFMALMTRYFFLSSFLSSSFFFMNSDNILSQSDLTLSNSSILAPF